MVRAEPACVTGQRRPTAGHRPQDFTEDDVIACDDRSNCGCPEVGRAGDRFRAVRRAAPPPPVLERRGLTATAPRKPLRLLVSLRGPGLRRLGGNPGPVARCIDGA